MGSHTCWLSYFTLVCLWCGWTVACSLARSIARSLDRSVYGHVITKFSGIDRLPHSLAMGLCPRARFMWEWSSAITFSKPSRPPGGGGGTPDFKWLGWLNGGKTQNPKKSLHQNLTPQKSHAAFPNHKIFEKALNDITRKIQTLVWNTRKNSYLNQATPKKILAKIFLPRKTLRSSLSPEIQTTPCDNQIFWDG